jgi:oxygen-independent coproporphyrinogen-3 oxidase
MESIYGPQLASLLERGLLEKTETGYRLTDFGVDVSNQVFVEFLL